MPHFLHVRSSAELDRLIKEELQAMRRAGAPATLLNRSVLVRSILSAVLRTRKGEPIVDERGAVLDGERLGRGLRIEVARELVQQVVVALERATDKALAEALVRLPGLLESELGLVVEVESAVGGAEPLDDDAVPALPVAPQPRKGRQRATRLAAAG
jgi:hypothetical protein